MYSKEAVKSELLKDKKKILFIVAFLLSGLGILFFWIIYTPKSTLNWTYIDESETALKDACGEVIQIYPLTSSEWPFPSFSPDRKYYIDISDLRFKRVKILKMFRSNTDQELGRYYSVFPSFFIHCWAADSSGVYISDYKPGTGSLFIPFSTGGEVGPAKKLLVPE